VSDPQPSGPRPTPVDPAVADRIRREPWAKALGIEYLVLERGHCRLALTLAPDMVNHQGAPHGGVIFTLADVAFGAACNSHGDTAVALTVTISFLAPALPGSRLIADAHERKRGRRAAFYDVLVTTADGTPIAQAHCTAHRKT
jgi:acyl-CoA thioesterase